MRRDLPPQQPFRLDLPLLVNFSDALRNVSFDLDLGWLFERRCFAPIPTAAESLCSLG